MFKKLFAALIVTVSTLSLVACGSTAGETVNREISASTSSSTSAESVLESSQESSVSSESAPTSKYYFENGVLQSEDVKIIITDYKVVDAGAEGNEFGEKPAIVFYYDITNLTGNESVTAAMGWLAMFEVIQDNDPNTVNTLDVGWYSDPDIDIDGYATIKKDGTVSFYMSYELDDTTTPVILKASRGVGGEALGEQTFNIA